MQNVYIIAVIFVFSVVLLLVIFYSQSKKKQKNRIIEQFGKIPDNYDLIIENINDYHDFMHKSNPKNHYLDNITWTDLNMNDVYKRINSCETSIGEEYLYHKLHKISFKESDDYKLNKWIDYFDYNKEKRVEFQLCLASIAKSKHNLTSLIFNLKTERLKYPAWIYMISSILASILLASTIISYNLSLKFMSAFLIGFVVVALFNIFIYYKTKLLLENSLEKISYFGLVLYGCKKIFKVKCNEKF